MTFSETIKQEKDEERSSESNRKTRKRVNKIEMKKSIFSFHSDKCNYRLNESRSSSNLPLYKL